jgi:3-hydroxyisobutyrate dehydrogenase-like beta-hydroxyacid dehydrogenase
VTKTVGILGTGDMGSAVGAMLRAAGYRVVTSLEQRSAHSRALATGAGLEDLCSLESLLSQSDLFLSILPPRAAVLFAERAAAVIRDRRLDLVYADCNAVAPKTVVEIAGLFNDGPARFADVGIVGPAPVAGTDRPTRFYVSGSDRQSVLDLKVPEITVIDMGGSVGRASAIKMCYAAMNKGTNALYTSLLLAARRLGVATELFSEFEFSQPEAARRMTRSVPYLAATAERFTGEMKEIAATFDEAGVSGDFYRGAEWLYGVLARSSLSTETRASLPAERSLDDALAAFAAVLDESQGELPAN